MKTFHLLQTPVKDKIVFLRTDYNVPLRNGKVWDTHKIEASLLTIKYLLRNNCKIVIGTHLGRPKGKIVKELKTDLLAKELKKLFPKVKITKLNDCIGKEIKEKIQRAKTKQIFLLENLRFYKEEQANDPAFAHSLADLAEIYVNDAFAVSHRKHASIEAITHFLPSIPGIQLEKEISLLGKVIKTKKKSVWIIGGAKLDKVDFINKALKKADKVLIGGALIFAFLKAKGYRVGHSKVDRTSVENAKKILRKFSARKLVLPIDFVVADKLSPKAKTEIVAYNGIHHQQIGLDLGPKTVELFKKQLSKAKVIVWNGPLGYFEWVKFSQATKEIGKFLGKMKVLKVAGGGETAEAIHQFHLEHNFSHVSTGGGAALTFISEKEMPGIKALERNYKKFKKP
jgi:phosphoglycerate kinase